jgi:hypothetical protein
MYEHYQARSGVMIGNWAYDDLTVFTQSESYDQWLTFSGPCV